MCHVDRVVDACGGKRVTWKSYVAETIRGFKLFLWLIWTMASNDDGWGWREKLLELCGWVDRSAASKSDDGGGDSSGKILGRGNTEAHPAGQPHQSHRSPS